MHQTVQTNGAALHILPFSREFEGSFRTGIENRPYGRSGKLERTGKNLRPPVSRNVFILGERRIRQEKVRDERTRVGRGGQKERWKTLFQLQSPVLLGCKIATLIVIRSAKADSRNYRKPTKISVRIRQLMKCVQTDCSVILESGAVWKREPQIREAGLTFVKNRAAKERMPLDVERNFWQTLGRFEKLIGLEPSGRADGVKRVQFGHRHDVALDRIEPKFVLVKILHHVWVAKLRHIDNAVDVIREVGAIFQADTITAGRHRAARQARSIYQRILVLKVIGFELGHAVIIRAVVNLRLKTKRDATAAAIIEPNTSLSMIGNREHHLGKERRSPRAQKSRRCREAKRVVERLVKIGPPEDRNVAKKEGHISKNNAIVFIDPDRARPEMKIRSRGVFRSKRAVADQVTVFGNLLYVFARKEIGFRRGAAFFPTDLFGLGVVDRALGQIEIDVAINPHIPLGDHFVGMRIVLGVIGIDVRIANMNSHVVARRR